MIFQKINRNIKFEFFNQYKYSHWIQWFRFSIKTRNNTRFYKSVNVIPLGIYIPEYKLRIFLSIFGFEFILKLFYK